MSFSDEPKQKELLNLMVSEVFTLMKHQKYNEAMEVVQFLGSMYIMASSLFITEMLRSLDPECRDENCALYQLLNKTLGEFLVNPPQSIELSVQQNMVMYDLPFPGWEPLAKLDEESKARIIEMRDLLKKVKGQPMSKTLAMLAAIGAEVEIGVVGGDLDGPQPPKSELN